MSYLVDGDFSGIDKTEDALERPRVDALQKDLLTLGLNLVTVFVIVFCVNDAPDNKPECSFVAGFCSLV